MHRSVPMLAALFLPTLAACTPPAASAPAAPPSSPAVGAQNGGSVPASPTPTTAATPSAGKPETGSPAKGSLCGKNVTWKVGLNFDSGAFYLHLDEADRAMSAPGCTGFALQLGPKLAEGSAITLEEATAHVLHKEPDGGPFSDNFLAPGAFTVVATSFKPSKDWKNPGTCRGTIKGTAKRPAGSKDGAHSRAFDVAADGSWEAPCSVR